MGTYKIHELSKEAKKAAIEEIKNRDSFQDREIDLDWLVESEQDELEDEFGLANVEISFNGFWSQGDGASFVGHVEDISKFMEAIGVDTSNIPDKALKALIDVYDMYIVRTDSRYLHENTVRFEIEETDDTELILMSPFGLGDITMDLNGLLEEIGLEDKASEWVKTKSKEIYRKLEKAYNDEFSDETVEEWADSMEIEFDEEGNEV
jgi:hypothetical protein